MISQGNGIYSAYLGPTATNAEVFVTMGTNHLGSNNATLGVATRLTDSNNFYKTYIDGTSLIIQKKVAGVTTTLATVSFPAQSSKQYSFRVRIVGSTIYAKVWFSKSTEPSNWTLTATDTSFQSGYFGLRIVDINNSTVRVTAYQATML